MRYKMLNWHSFTKWVLMQTTDNDGITKLEVTNNGFCYGHFDDSIPLDGIYLIDERWFYITENINEEIHTLDELTDVANRIRRMRKLNQISLMIL